MPKIILASNSPQRQELLTRLGLKFTAVSSNYQEKMDLKLKPTALAKHLALGKAHAVAKKYPNSLVIAADTFVVFKNNLLGKPGTKLIAKKMLKKISGQVLKVITGFAIIDTVKNNSLSKVIVTKISIRKLSAKEIDKYVQTGEPLDKAGAFAVQGLGASLIKKIEGDYTNVVGLPIIDLVAALKKIGVKLL